MFRIIVYVVYYLVVDVITFSKWTENNSEHNTYYINATMSSDLSIENNIMCPVVYTSVLFELTYGREYCATIKYGV